MKLQIFENIAQLIIESKTFPICTRDAENTNRMDKYPRPINKPAKVLTIIVVSLVVTSKGKRKLLTPGVSVVTRPTKSNKIEATRIIPRIIIKPPAYIEQLKTIFHQYPSIYTFLCNF